MFSRDTKGGVPRMMCECGGREKREQRRRRQETRDCCKNQNIFTCSGFSSYTCKLSCVPCLRRTNLSWRRLLGDFPCESWGSYPSSIHTLFFTRPIRIYLPFCKAPSEESIEMAGAKVSTSVLHGCFLGWTFLSPSLSNLSSRSGNYGDDRLELQELLLAM